VTALSSPQQEFARFGMFLQRRSLDSRSSPKEEQVTLVPISRNNVFREKRFQQNLYLSFGCAPKRCNSLGTRCVV